jgi:putative ABC transport system permease protein
MLLQIAWRNLWRNKRRSLIMLSSIAIGVAVMFMTDTLVKGMGKQMIDNQIKSYISHIKIHKKGFNDNKVIQNVMPQTGIIERALDKSENVTHWGRRVAASGLISSSMSSAGVQFIGVEQEKEREISDIADKMTEGEYLTGKPLEIIIGHKMADKLEVELEERIVIVSRGLDGSVAQNLYRVSGIFETGSDEFDKMYVFVNLESAQKMLGLGNKINEIAMVTSDYKQTFEYKDEVVANIKAELKASGQREDAFYGRYEVLTYQEIIPMLVKYVGMFDVSMWLMYSIIIIAILFGIVNSMIMAVFERVQEFGVLMSIGMKNGKIVTMVLSEAFMLGALGAVFGVILGYLGYLPMADGLDLSVFAESLSTFGTGSIIYPIVNFGVISNALLIMPIASVFGAIYPAWRAIQLQPTDAMRYV